MKKRHDFEFGAGEHIPTLDDYELKPHYDLDPRKAKPNRFAGRAKFSAQNPRGKMTQGGGRVVAGRKSAPEPVERHTISLYRSHAKFLRSMDSNLSNAIRKLIEAKR